MTSHPLRTMDDTQALAARIATCLAPGDTLFLRGKLGAGKTSFAQALIGALSPSPVEVTSPTFTLVQSYPVQLSGRAVMAHHYDLYRIEQPSALAELGMDEGAPELRLIEWPERLPANFYAPSWLALHFTLEGHVRAVRVSSGGDLKQRWMEQAA